MNDNINYNLLENAEDSLKHAVEHLTGDKITNSDYKRAILDVSHVVELLLKERLRRIHPSFIWENIDKYPSVEAMTTTVEKAMRRLIKIGNVSFSEELQKAIINSRKVRNKIEHYEITLSIKEAEVIIGNLLSFIFKFSKDTLGLDYEKQFRKDEEKWEKLIAIYDFYEIHRKVIEEQADRDNIYCIDCPNCGASVFDYEREVCLLCEYSEHLVECSFCEYKFFESEVNNVMIDGVEKGKICEHCRDKNGDYEYIDEER